MKALLLVPGKYSFSRKINSIFQRQGYETIHLDFRDSINPINIRFNAQVFRLPFSIRKKWINYFLTKINKLYIQQFNTLKPDLVFVYNNEMLLPETVKWLLERKIKIVFYLGDNPLYSHTSPYNLTVLEYANAVFVPDTFWQIQLQKLGIKNVNYLLMPLPDDDYYPVNINEIDINFKTRYQSDVFYTGMCYNDSWGYKKAKFLNYFTGFDLKIFGNNAWKKWFSHFPQLEKHFEERKSYIPTPELNKMYNHSKIVPVDGNPGIFNGIHVRITEAIAAGTLPIMEWNADMDFIFEGINNLPAVRTYDEIPERADFYVNNETARKEMVEKMRQTYRKKYNAETVQKILFQALGL